ncbi:MAG TPA: flippase, partial [bacterium]|nr:flippase [bacterium]
KEIISRFIGFLTTIYIAKKIGPTNFGNINLSLVILSYFELFSDFGISTVAIKELARETSKKKFFIIRILILRLLFSFFSFVVLCLITKLFWNNVLDITVIYGLTLLIGAFTLEWVFIAFEKMLASNIIIIIFKIIYAAAIFYFIKLPNHYIRIPIIFTLSAAMTAIFLVILLYNILIKENNEDKNNKILNKNFFQNIINSALPLFISMFFVQIIINSDTLILGYFRSAFEVGIYNAAYRLIFFIAAIGTVYYNTIFPRLSKLYKENHNELFVILNFTSKFICYLSIPMAFGCIILSKKIILFFYNDQYIQAIFAFSGLTIATALMLINNIYCRAMIACDRHKEYLKIVIFQATINFIPGLFFIPKYGITAAVLLTILAEISGFYFYYKSFSKILIIPFLPYLIKALFSSIIMSAFLLFFINWNLFILIISGILIYFTILYSIKGFTFAEIKTFLKK